MSPPALGATCTKRDITEGNCRPTSSMLSTPTPDVSRPTACPFCHKKIIDTLAKVISTSTHWRCLSCNATWTIASLAASTTRREPR